MADPSPPLPSPSPQSPESLLSFYRLVGQLKTTKRTGWQYRHVNLPESVSDHMYRMSLIALTAREPGIDPVHAMKLALVHDLAEAIVGDITPLDKVSKSQKHALELAAMAHIRDDVLKGTHMAREMFALWEEYEEAESASAQLVKQIDKLEMIIQADEYECAQGMDLSEFFESTTHALHTPQLQAIDALLRAERAHRLHNAPSPSSPSAPPPPGGEGVDADADSSRM